LRFSNVADAAAVVALSDGTVAMVSTAIVEARRRLLAVLSETEAIKMLDTCTESVCATPFKYNARVPVSNSVVVMDSVTVNTISDMQFEHNSQGPPTGPLNPTRQ
jgi:hypothetical protein